MTDCNTAQLMADFKNDRIEPGSFGHIQHVQAAYGLLRHHTFADAVGQYIRGIQKLAITAGAPDKFNMTITLAYLGLIAERIKANQTADWDQFIAANEDLLDRQLLMRWYTPESLHSDAARHCFVMPEPATR